MIIARASDYLLLAASEILSFRPDSTYTFLQDGLTALVLNKKIYQAENGSRSRLANFNCQKREKVTLATKAL